MRLWIWPVVATLGLAGCAGGVSRHPVPPALRDQAMVPGMPADVRTWGDDSSPEFRRGIAESFRQLRSAYGDRQPRDVLALSGGGADGAFGAGFLCGWTAAGTRPVFRVVTGVSAGAITATFAFLGPDYDDRLTELATNVTTRDIYYLKGLTAALGSDSLASTEPLARLIERQYDRRLLDAVAAEHAKGRRLYVGTADLDAQRPVVWDMGAIASSHSPNALRLFRKVILASGAIPAYFPPVYVGVEAGGRKYDEMHVDGGTVNQVFLYSDALSPPAALREANAPQNASPAPAPLAPATPPAVVYIIRNAKIGPEPQRVEPRLLHIAGRSISTLTKYQAVGDMYRIYFVTRRDRCDFNLAYIPSDVDVPPASTIGGFDRQYMAALYNSGYSLSRAGYAWHKAPPA